jgi:nucleotide-binding universal stress UspA family protein
MRIVIAMDFSEASIDAARWVARHLGKDAELLFAHAVYVPEPPSFLRSLYPPSDQVVEDARRGASARLADVSTSIGHPHTTTEVRIGRPDEVLVQIAEDNRADLLVVGPRRQRPGIRLMLGSTGERVARRCKSSVLIARDLPDEGPLTVLAALDESRLAPAVVAWAERLVKGDAARAIALHVADPMLYGAVRLGAYGNERARAEEQLRSRVDEWLTAQLKGSRLEVARRHAALGDPGFEILDAVEKFGADMLVIGRHGERPSGGGFLGSVVEFVLRDGSGPVFVVGDAPESSRD